MLLPFCPCFIKWLGEVEQVLALHLVRAGLGARGLNDASVGRGAEGVQGMVIARHAGDNWMAHLEGR
jgi:hypothetical protein